RKEVSAVSGSKMPSCACQKTLSFSFPYSSPPKQPLRRKEKMLHSGKTGLKQLYFLFRFGILL
ncbi:hypothetical protein LJC27_07525, partial [Christensenellaceae bacterium OttesenSCG-928-M15]|nr:hypothetical protein [Christensenellaceae bacterium OttesenSCG-928-M15]